MDRSWFSRVSSSRNGELQNSIHELPRWRTPSPMVASMIPPPIVQSTYATSPPSTARSITFEKASPLRDRQSELEADLQFLLDAQAEGLVRGLGVGVPDDETSTGSTTPTAHSGRGTSERRTAKPVRRKLGLRSARKGIYSSIIALSAVKNEELQSIDIEVGEKDVALAQIDEWEQKRHGLQQGTKSIDGDEETVRAERLRQEAIVLQQEINHVELQLADMKGRHRKLLRQVAATENSVQAKLASYTSSLSMLEADVQRFLSIEPVDRDAQSLLQDAKSSMWQLPPQRRTLEMAKVHFGHDRAAVLRQREHIEYEKDALDEGAAVWKDVVAKVTDFEKQLRTEMAKLSTASNSGSAWEDPPQREAPELTQELLLQLNTVVVGLEEQLKLAETREWSLLMAAIGAELDALRQGKRILEGVLGISPTPSSDRLEAEVQPSSGSRNEGDGEIDPLDASLETARQRETSNGNSSVSDTDTDEDPDPELLFSRSDNDSS